MHRVVAALTSALAFAVPIAAQALTYDVLITNADVSFSPPSFAVGDHVRIYAIVRNLGDRDVEGNIFFSEHGVTIGTPPHVSAKARSAEEEVWVDWDPTTAGERQIFVRAVTDPRTPDQDRSNNETIVRVNVAPRPPPPPPPPTNASAVAAPTSSGAMGTGTTGAPQGTRTTVPAPGSRVVTPQTTPSVSSGAPPAPIATRPPRSTVAVSRHGNSARPEPVVVAPLRSARPSVAPLPVPNRAPGDARPATAPSLTPPVVGVPVRDALPPVTVANLLGSAPSSRRATAPLIAGSTVIVALGLLARLLRRSRRTSMRHLDRDDLA